MEALIQQILQQLDVAPQRPGLQKTPQRVEKAWRFLTQGYHSQPDSIMASALFAAENDNLVILRNIDLYSLCEHHLLPFYGQCHIGYIPNQHIVGLSKLSKVVTAYSQRLQVQERLTQQIAECIERSLKPHGVAVVIEASHMCMSMRGVQKSQAIATTSCMLGRLRHDGQQRDEFLRLIHATDRV